MKVVVVGGVAGGMSAAARLRRLDETADIVVLERDAYVSFANCGLPYHIGGDIEDREALLLQTPESLRETLALDVRTGHEVLSIDRDAKTRRRARAGDGPRVRRAVRQPRARHGCLAAAATAAGHRPPAHPHAAQHPRHGRDHRAARRRRAVGRGRGRRLHRHRDGRGAAAPRHGGHPGRGARPGDGRARPRDGPPARGPHGGPRHARAAVQQGRGLRRRGRPRRRRPRRRADHHGHRHPRRRRAPGVIAGQGGRTRRCPSAAP